MNSKEAKTIRKHLISEIRRGERSISYKALLSACRLGYIPNSNQLGDLLNAVSEFERQKSRPVLSAMVINQETGLPGVGFYDLLKGINLSAEEKYKQEIGAVLGFWLDDDNYLTSFNDDEGL